MSDAPAGWKLVPQIATVAQLSAGQKAWCADPLRKSSTLYAAMVAAAPEPAPQPITRELLEQSGFVTWLDDDLDGDEATGLVKWLFPGEQLGLRLDQEPGAGWYLTLITDSTRERQTIGLWPVTDLSAVVRLAEALSRGSWSRLP